MVTRKLFHDTGDTPAQDALWRRLQAFNLDLQDAELPFSRRLARDNGWSPYFTNRVIMEYKRFCYVAVRTRHPVTPPDAVDRAWHLHLLYTWNYWEEFCPKVLECKLHHGPTRGGGAEQAKFRTWYEDTLYSYTQIFRTTPPDDVRTDPDTRSSGAPAFRRIDARTVFPVSQLRGMIARLCR